MLQEFATDGGGGRVVYRPGLPTPIPGLFIADQAESGFSLTHQRSGFAVLWADSPEIIATALTDLAGIDWTRPGTEIQLDPEALAAFNRARLRDGVRAYSNRGAPAVDLEATS